MDHLSSGEWLPATLLLVSQLFVFLSHLASSRAARGAAAELLAHPTPTPSQVADLD
jgi:hypothetical protein